MQVLVVVVMAALASPATWAESDGDMWSAVEQVQRSPGPVLHSAPRAEHGTTARQAGNQARTARTDAMAAGQTGSEGGDTWSRFVPQPAALPTNTAGIVSEPPL